MATFSIKRDIGMIQEYTGVVALWEDDSLKTKTGIRARWASDLSGWTVVCVLCLVAKPGRLSSDKESSDMRRELSSL